MAGRAVSLLAAILAAQQPDFEPLYRQALAEREQKLGKGDRKTRESERDLALYLAHRGEYAKAEPYRETALALADTLEAATALHNWAVALEQQDPPGAERMYRRVLEIRSKLLPPQDVELAATKLNLAALLMARSGSEAEALASQALAAFEKKFGPVDTRVGAACQVLGAVQATRGKVVAAEQLFRRGLSIAEKVHGPESEQTAAALENLAELLQQTGRELSARPLLERAQRIRLRTR
ncbi:MAG: tetratricopeptide repeat protein [Bryobacteraceae bacterium]|nr:tetratricopeptide repeat protein [Bryobacteraceae bacterium]MDW8379162.1 tetratricopeptide repeat protein [Bryobacterales bacterium]